MKDDLLKPECMNPQCTRHQSARGLCSNCFQIARRLIRQELISWDDLVKAGKALPKRLPGRKASIARKWMLEK
jgi:hypothetical protein